MSTLLTDKYLESVIKKPEKIRVSATHAVPMYGVKKESGESIPFEMSAPFLKALLRRSILLAHTLT